MKYDFDRIANREGSNCIKYDGRESAFGNANVIPMWIADMDFPAPEFITEAIMQRASHPVYGYGLRDDDYFNSIINWVSRHNGWEIQKEWIDFTPGVVAGFVFAIRALTSEGDGVVIMPPTYPPFASQIKANGRKVINNPLMLRDGRYMIDYDDLDRKLKGASALLFCNPHNPSGRVFCREELMRVGELCCKHKVAIISDEIHSDLVQKPHKHTHISSLCKDFGGRCITLIAPSKTFNLAGLSVSVAITPDDQIREKLRGELDRYHVDQGNVFGTVALTAAYTHGDEWLEQLLDYVRENMEFAEEYFRQNMPQVKPFKSEGTYLMWINFRGLGLSHEELCHFLNHEAGVGLNSGKEFGEEGCGFMRMNMATSREVVRTALERIRDAWAARSGRQ